MFTGIVEAIGVVEARVVEGSNVHFSIKSALSNQLGVDDSVSHNGVCLTVTKIENDGYWVTAVDETLKRTNVGNWQIGSEVNLERSLVFNGRIDGHLVQGHVDSTATCVSIVDENGSFLFTFQLDAPTRLLVHKGSVCVNGVSLTVIEPTDDSFSVAVIPYTFNHTTFKHLKVGEKVNVEFDVIGKYLERFAQPFLARQPNR
jgi:riboflavin synthase